MFSPTHILISRTKETPVQLMATRGGYKLYTEVDLQQGREASFELKPKQGIFCQGIPVVGFQLAPMPAEAEATARTEASRVSK
jgi:hypothetical protein